VVPIMRWAAYWLMSASLAAAVFLKGGVYPRQWTWSALGLSVAAALALTTRANNGKQLRSSDKWGLGVMVLLLAWMIFQLAPLPPTLVKRLTPEHWNAVAAARKVTGQDPGAWVSFSVAPSATFARLLDVVPAMAALLVAREMASWWRDRIWIAIAPVLGAASFQSLVGLAQFYLMPAAGGQPGSVSGTYVNRNHFAGLLEMAFPVAVALAISAWRKGASQRLAYSSVAGETAGPALPMVLYPAASACLLAGVVVSQSRMGFISTLAGAGFSMLIVPLSRIAPPQRDAATRDAASEDAARPRDQTDRAGRGWRQAWRWAVPLAVPLSILILLPTRELVLRFADMASTQEVSTAERVKIWRDTLHLIGAYKWTGCGLGAFEHGFYLHQTAAPVNTVDFAHNDFLQILAELGILGALLAGALVGWIAARTLAVVLWGRGAKKGEMAAGPLFSLVTVAVHSLADFNLYIPANALVFAWLSGVAVSPGLRRH
jgi:O-antigen ligase